MEVQKRSKQEDARAYVYNVRQFIEYEGSNMSDYFSTSDLAFEFVKKLLSEICTDDVKLWIVNKEYNPKGTQAGLLAAWKIDEVHIQLWGVLVNSSLDEVKVTTLINKQ